MSKTKALAGVIMAAALSASPSYAQYKGPPIIVQTPQPQPPSTIQTAPTLTVPSTGSIPQISAPATAAAPPAQAAPARPCAANTRC